MFLIAQIESQSPATTSSSSNSSEQTVEDTPTPDDHVTSPSPSPYDNDDGTVVEALVPSEPACQSESITSSEFELGMTAPSRACPVVFDSPIKAPNVIDEFLQDSFLSLSIVGMI